MIYRLAREYDAETLNRAVGGRLVGDNVKIDKLTLDSRDKNSGGMFIAIKGERFDGHDFAEGAVKSGAVLIICERELKSGATEIIVSDTIEALGKIGSYVRHEINPIVAAVTGSVGKTTTKQLIYSVLSEHYITHKTEGNLNNLIGLPLTLIGLREEHKAAALEFGMSARGEISRLSKIASPDVAVITNIGSSHLEYLGTRENIRDAKLEIRDGLKADGTLILNGDEPLLAGIEGAKYISMKGAGDYNITEWHIGDDGTYFNIEAHGAVCEKLFVPAIGGHIAFDSAAAFAVGDTLGLSEDEIRRGLSSFRNTGMRQSIFNITVNEKKITVIDDCYNASPESMRASLDVLAGQAGGNGIAVLGDMRELGENSAQLHRQVGEYAAKIGIKAVFTFGEDAAEIAEGAKIGGDTEVYSFTELSDPDTIAAALRSYIKAGDTLLFKASRAVEMERVLNRLNG